MSNRVLAIFILWWVNKGNFITEVVKLHDLNFIKEFRIVWKKCLPQQPCEEVNQKFLPIDLIKLFLKKWFFIPAYMCKNHSLFRYNIHKLCVGLYYYDYIMDHECRPTWSHGVEKKLFLKNIQGHMLQNGIGLSS